MSPRIPAAGPWTTENSEHAMADSAGSPLVSIGLPVYNGADYLQEALDSLLAQDYPHIELIISDNGSVDDTPTIGRDCAQRDPRVSYHRVDENRGAAWNFRRVFELARGEFFMWAAHDDLWHPRFVSRCLAALLADETAALCHAVTQPVLADKRPAAPALSGPAYTNSEPSLRRRWRASVTNWHLHAMIYGLMRRALAERTRLVPPCIAGDQVFVAELSLHGTIIQVPETLTWKRYPGLAVEDRTLQQLIAICGDRASYRFGLVRLEAFREFLRGLAHAGLARPVRRCLTLDTVAAYCTGGFLVADLKSLFILGLGPERYRSLGARLKPLVRGRARERRAAAGAGAQRP